MVTIRSGAWLVFLFAEFKSNFKCLQFDLRLDIPDQPYHRKEEYLISKIWEGLMKTR